MGSEVGFVVGYDVRMLEGTEDGAVVGIDVGGFVGSALGYSLS